MPNHWETFTEYAKDKAVELGCIVWAIALESILLVLTGLVFEVSAWCAKKLILVGLDETTVTILHWLLNGMCIFYVARYMIDDIIRWWRTLRKDGRNND